MMEDSVRRFEWLIKLFEGRIDTCQTYMVYIAEHTSFPNFLLMLFHRMQMIDLLIDRLVDLKLGNSSYNQFIESILENPKTYALTPISYLSLVFGSF